MNYNEAEIFLDALKEMHIRLLHGNEVTKEAVSKLSEETQGKLNNIDDPQGFLGAAIHVFDELKQIEDLMERMELAVAFMGTTVEDLGLC